MGQSGVFPRRRALLPGRRPLPDGARTPRDELLRRLEQRREGGEHLQTLDMNQDNYLGESFKMRNLLECFRGNVRIVGFREHIFSEQGGAVANFAASNEFVFGTSLQRFLTFPLCVRFHYGHPDVWDKVWALSNGGVSKASRTLHVSEDIFGGINVILRGGSISYEEFIHCGKGRDMGFIAVACAARNDRGAFNVDASLRYRRGHL